MSKIPAWSSSSLSLLGAPILLAMKSPEEFALLQAALIDEIEPEGPIERMYVENAAAILWDLKSLRQTKALIVRSASRAALENLLKQLIRDQQLLAFLDNEAKAEQLAFDYFRSKAKKKEALEILSQFGLDERAIDAEAFRSCLPDLGTLDKMLISSEKRWNKTIRLVAEYRKDLARHLCRSADRVLEEAESPDLELQDKRPAAA